MATIQGLYLALFGRPADPRGLAFFSAATANGTNLVAIGPLEASAEFQGRFGGQSNSAIINAIYQSLFNRPAEPAGLNFFLDALNQKQIGSISGLAAAIIDGARGDDLIILRNKLAAANAFTTAVDTPAEIAGYAGATSAAIAQAFLTGVTTTIPTQAQVDDAVARATGLAVIDTGPANSTVLLTTGTDNFTGTSAVETYVAVAATAGATFNVADSVNGGAGTDILNLTINALPLNSVPAASFTAVENIFVRNLSGAEQTINGANFVGHQQLWSDRSTSPVTFTNVAAGASVGLQGDGATVLKFINATYVAGAASATLAIANGVNFDGGTDVSIVGAGLTSLTINSTGAANAIDDLTVPATITAVTINATTNLTIGAQSGGVGLTGVGPGSTLTISGAASSVVLADQLYARFKSVDASGLAAGGATIILDGDQDTTFKGGQGNDIVSTGAVLTTGSADAGAGTADRLIVTDNSHLATAALGAKYTNFEQLQVNDGVTVDLDNIAGITSIFISDQAGATGVLNLTAAQAAAVTIMSANGNSGPITIGVKGATTNGQIDTVAITVDDGVAGKSQQNLGTPILAGVEKLSIVAAEGVQITSLTGAPALNTVTATGAGNFFIDTGTNSVAGFRIDASGNSGTQGIAATAYAVSGVTILTGTGNATLVVGSAQDDVIIIGSGGSTTINPALGADQIDLTASVGKADILKIFSGNSIWDKRDTITGFTNAATTGDKLDLEGAAAIGSNAPSGTATGIANLTVSANSGVITFGGNLAGTATLADKIAAVAFVAEAQYETYVFEHGGKTYVFQNTDGTAVNSGALTNNDIVVELTDVTLVTALSLTVSAANTIWIA